MLLSKSWLSRHLDLTGLSDARLEDALIRLGVEVDAVASVAVPAEHLVVARILAAEPHPQADRLKVTQVDVGEGEPRQIVCGAKNYRVGDFVPCALPGCVLPPRNPGAAPFTIQVGLLRGVESRGMLCAAEEIGLSDDRDGLMLLSGSPAPGTPLIELFPAETTFTLEVTPNRPDCLSQRGIARELGAFFGRPLRTGESTAATPQAPAAGSVTLEDQTGCPLYTLRRLTGLTNGPSPDWLRQPLRAIGLNPISALVDVTNFILHDLGQPLHAFDAAKIDGPLTVRRARTGETFLALDEKTYELTEDDLVIADNRGPVALAGVMGGLHSGVSDSTTAVLLESAWFDPASVRRTSRRLGLISDSSMQFERGADPELAAAASDRAAALMLECCGGEAGAELLVAGAAPPRPAPIPLEPKAVEALLGVAIDSAEIHRILHALGLEADSGNETQPGQQRWTVPSWRRADLHRPVDLIEEIARLHGLDKIPSRHQGSPAQPGDADRAALAADSLRDQLAALGLAECRTLKLAGFTTELDRVGAAFARPLKNPLSADLDHLRPSLVPGLLAVVARDEAQGRRRHALFELGTVFPAADPQPAASGKRGRPLSARTQDQSQSLALLLSGPARAAHWSDGHPAAFDFADLRGLLEALLPEGTRLKLAPADQPGLIRAVSLKAGKAALGWAGILRPALQRQLDAEAPVLLAELDLDALLALRQRAIRYQAPPRFPATSRDLALEAPLDLPAQQVQAFFNGLNQPLLEGVELFDLFTDPTGLKIAADAKSLGWRLTYRAPDRTLETAEVEAIHGAVRGQIARQLPVKLR